MPDAKARVKVSVCARIRRPDSEEWEDLGVISETTYPPAPKEPAEEEEKENG